MQFGTDTTVDIMNSHPTYPAGTLVILWPLTSAV